MTYPGDTSNETAHPLGATVITGGDVWLIDPDLNTAGAYLRTFQVVSSGGQHNKLYRGTDSANPLAGAQVAKTDAGSGISWQNIFFPPGEGIYLDADPGTIRAFATVDYL